MIIKTYQPGKIENLYDQNNDSLLKGVLYFQQNEPNLEQLEPNKEETLVEQSIPESLEKSSETSTIPLAERFLQFAFQVDSFIFGGFKHASSKVTIGYFASYQWLFSVISMLNLIIDSARKEKVQEFTKKGIKLGSKISNLKITKPSVSFPTFSMPSFSKAVTPEITISAPQLSLPKINFSKLRLPLAFICLVVSFLSIGALLFPLISAQLFSVLPASTKATPQPTPFVYDNYYQNENDPLYPIREFRLSVPKINLESAIVDNVDPNIEGEYKDKLQSGVAHAKGSYLPPEKGGPVYLFAHSTDTIFNIARFNAKFYSVRELEAGDEIDVFFNGKKYTYVVQQKMIIDPHKVDIIQEAKTDLILQTCWPPGTDWQRLIVLANLKEPATAAAVGQ